MIARTGIAETLEACFEEIRTTRMAGIPVLNAALSVKTVGERHWNGFFMCVLVTPWFMNLIALPGDESTELAETGSKRIFALPAGSFEFIAGFELAIGGYWMCSLFSPMFEFADQDAAEATAEAALETIFGAQDEPDASEQNIAAMWRGERPCAEEATNRRSSGEDQDDEICEPVAAEINRRSFLSGGRASAERPR